MGRIICLALLFGLLSVCAASTAPPCNWDGLGFNPWARWNVFAFGDIGSASLPYGSDFEGRAAAGGSMWMQAFTFNLLGDNSYPYAVTAGGTFTHFGGDVMNGGIQAGGEILFKNVHVFGNVLSKDGTVWVGGSGSGEASTVQGTVKSGVQIVKSPGSSYTLAGSGIFNNLALDVDLDQVKNFFTATSTAYQNLASNFDGIENDGFTNGDIKVLLKPGVNVINVGVDISFADLNKAARLLLSGPLDATLIINVGGTSRALDVLDIYQSTGTTFPASPGTSGQGRVIFNFYAALDLSIASPSFYSILAPNAVLTYDTGVIQGNVVVKDLIDPVAGGAQVNLQPWLAECPPQSTPPSPPGDTQEIPSPPEECPPCPWDYLGFNPWDWFNVFSLSDIGSAAKPLGADFQGRVAAVGSAWFKAFSLHDIQQAPGTWFSATVGQDFTLWGGSINNGGVEAGRDIRLEAADVLAGDVVAGRDVYLGATNKAATVGGQVLAGNNVIMSNPSDGSSAAGGIFDQQTVSLSIDLAALAAFYTDASTNYRDGNPAGSTATIVLANSGYDGEITVQSGLNYLTLTSTVFIKLARIRLIGPADAVLVINVAGATLNLDSLDVYVDVDYTIVPTYGRVLVNFHEATEISIQGSGYWSLLAPLATVTYSSGVFTGNWIVGNLQRMWEGGTQINVLPFQPPCPPCIEVYDVLTCEGGTASFSCPLGTTITILEANYGRTEPGSSVCPHNQILTTQCFWDVAAEVQSQCSGISCSVPATNSNLGPDPCVNTYKYLQARYTCSPELQVTRKTLPQTEGRTNKAQNQRAQPQKRASARGATAQSTTTEQTAFQQQAQQSATGGIPQWAMIAGGAVAGIALSALVVAGVAIRKLAGTPLRSRRAAGGVSAMPATPSGFNAMSPQSVSSSVSHRGGRGPQFATSP